VTIPTDGLEVWVKRSVLSPAWLGTWSLSAQTFTHASGLTLLWYRVYRWKHVVEPPP
jgi:23S rRNA pseudoU1915 N3-methylase RlmH